MVQKYTPAWNTCEFLVLYTKFKTNWTKNSTALEKNYNDYCVCFFVNCNRFGALKGMTLHIGGGD